MLAKEETAELNIQIHRNIFDSRGRQLLITPEFIQLEFKPGSDTFIVFNKNELTEFRYGINWISGYAFNIGREYVFFASNSSNEVMKISFKSFYGIKKKEYHKLWHQILTKVCEFYFADVADDLIKEFFKGKDINIGRAAITKKGINVDEGGLFKNSKKEFAWEGLKIKNYYTYVAIYSSGDASRHNARFSYLNDWNTWVLINVVKTILKHKNASLN